VLRYSICACLLILAACGGPAPRRAPDDAIHVLTAQADAWDRAIVRKDRAAIEANMAAEFRHVDSHGRVSSHAAFVDGVLDAKLEIDPYAVDDFEIRVLGDAALLSGTTRMTGRWDGKPFTTHYRYTDVYARDGAAWRVVNVQITGLPD
jgi:ketosteroid isomerase-like protein